MQTYCYLIGVHRNTTARCSDGPCSGSSTAMLGGSLFVFPSSYAKARSEFRKGVAPLSTTIARSRRVHSWLGTIRPGSGALFCSAPDVVETRFGTPDLRNSIIAHGAGSLGEPNERPHRLQLAKEKAPRLERLWIAPVLQKPPGDPGYAGIARLAAGLNARANPFDRRNLYEDAAVVEGAGTRQRPGVSAWAPMFMPLRWHGPFAAAPAVRTRVQPRRSCASTR